MILVRSNTVVREKELRTYYLPKKPKDPIYKRSLASKIGKGQYAMAVYEKIKRITIPLENDHLLLVTLEIDSDHDKIINGILSFIKK